MAITTIGESYQVVIPQDIRETLHLEPGERLDVRVEEGNVVMVRLPSHTSRLFGKHRDLWKDTDAVAYIRGERESWRD